jgi:hypothetical protein
MRISSKSFFIATAAMACLSLSACKKEAPPAPPAPPVVETAPVTPVTPPVAAAAVSVSSVDLGRAVGADKAISDATTTFATKDTIYASVATTGSMAGTSLIAVKWTYQTGDVVKEDSASLELTGPAITDFSISNPNPWPVGKYKVDVSLNGALVQSKDFEVK